MFNNILVATDLSELNKQVFEEALNLAKASGASLMLLHVLSSEEEGAPQMPTMTTLEYYPGLDSKIVEIYREQWQAYEAQSLELLRSRVEEATAAGVKAEFSQNYGSPGRTICEFARDCHADLITIGRRGRFGFSELFLGSVSNYVLHHAPCSVLIVHHRSESERSPMPQEKEETFVT
jgi:nucleotide-binding universal stress UspA family protein